jgi:hypothetical protein
MFSDVAVSTAVVRLTHATSQLHDPLSLVFLWVIVWPFWFAPLGWLQFHLLARQRRRQG